MTYIDNMYAYYASDYNTSPIRIHLVLYTSQMRSLLAIITLTTSINFLIAAFKAISHSGASV